jgi:hypothetical protein
MNSATRGGNSGNTFTWEVRLIVRPKNLSLVLVDNLTLERSIHSASVNQGVAFSPNLKFIYDLTRKFARGLEYNGSVGSAKGVNAVS